MLSHKHLRFFIFLLSLLFLVPILKSQELSEPEKNFEHLWQTFDRNYGIFTAKKIDWDALYEVYRPKVTAETTDDELFEIMANLLAHLNDNHVRLFSTDNVFQSGILGELKMEDFSLELIKEKYLTRTEQRVQGVFTFGWLTDDIGYFHFSGFGRMEQSTAAIDEIISEFKDAKGLVVDVRNNGGGSDRVGKVIADRFADRKRLYMITYTRNGPQHDDFTPPLYWYVEPDGENQFQKPIILLTHRHSVSAADNFALAMRVIPHVTVVGDATSGAMADVYGDRLPNGWQVGVPYKLFVDYDHFCWEGIGIPPDIRQTNSKEDIEQGRDRVLEFAIELLNTGALQPQEEKGSLENLRISIVDVLREKINAEGIAEAVAAYQNIIMQEPEEYYLDYEAMDRLGHELLDAGKTEAAIEIFKINTQEFPEMYRTHESLADAYFNAGKEELARQHYKKTMETNRQSYPWEKRSYAMAQKILSGGKVLHKELMRSMQENRLEKALQEYRKKPDSYYLDENALNGLGYSLLRSEQADQAIEVLRINTEAFPNSWNAWDSLAEAYMVAGNKEKAIAYYQKSIEMNPHNNNGKKMLEKLQGE